ncbi:elongation factor TS-domain-containing protein [Rhizoctonia solani]|nr:elongation factor TS-domain-containing protein [Rhizoctonia solani]
MDRIAITGRQGTAIITISRNAELKASIKLIAEIRKITDNQTSFAKAKEALLATNNQLDAALEWLEKDNIASGAKKAAKVASRIANDGLVGISVLADGGSQAGSSSVRAAMVEVNCETDFVARNEIFSKLVADIAHTTAYLAEAPSESQALSKPGLISPFPVDILADAPLVRAPTDSSISPDPANTIFAAIQDATSKLGEKISLRRACSFVGPALPPSSNIGLRVGSYLHLSSNQSQTGKIGALVALALKSNNLAKFTTTGEADTRALARALARQVVGLGADRVGDAAPTELGDPSSTALYEQPFMMQPGGGTDKSVRNALNVWAQEKGLASGGEDSEGVQVIEFVKWTAGEGIEKHEPEGGFAEEVRRLSS